MIWIAHRGNCEGPSPARENDPRYLEEALAAGYDVEIDCWVVRGRLYVGHDGPAHPVAWEFLGDRFWCHAKNPDALRELLARDLHCFAHDRDPFVLTSRGFLWTYPGQELGPRSIAVLPEQAGWPSLIAVAGVCSDYVARIA